MAAYARQAKNFALGGSFVKFAADKIEHQQHRNHASDKSRRLPDFSAREAEIVVGDLNQHVRGKNCQSESRPAPQILESVGIIDNTRLRWTIAAGF
jgi:hypothetical protein